jgi:hypothetical protein
LKLINRPTRYSPAAFSVTAAIRGIPASLEGTNNKIKVLKRVAYGFRDEAYFFLKIRAAFPGIP